MPTTITVERFTARGDQRLNCGHIVGHGDSLVDLRFGDDITARVVSLCESCFASVGRLGAPR